MSKHNRRHESAPVQEAPVQEAPVQEAAPAVPPPAAPPAPEAAPAPLSEEARIKLAGALLRKCEGSYKRGVKDHVSGLLESGRYACEFTSVKYSLGATRGAIVQEIAAPLASHAREAVDVSELMDCYATHALLTGSPETDNPACPYRHLRIVWRRLTRRVETKDTLGLTTAEHWELLPGMEDDIRAAWSKAQAGNLEIAALEPIAADIVRRYAGLAEAKAKAKAEADKAKAAADREAWEKAQKEKADAQEAKAKAAEEAREKARDAQEEKDAQERERKLREAREAAERAEAVAAEAKAKADAEAALRHDASKSQREADKSASAADKATNKALKADSLHAKKNNPTAEATRGVNLLSAAQNLPPEGFAADIILPALAASGRPDDFTVALLRKLAGWKELSHPIKRAIAGACLVIDKGAAAAASTAGAAPAA